MAEYDEIKPGNLYKLRVRLFSDAKYKIFLTEEEVKLKETDYLILGKIEPISHTGVVGGVSVELSDSAFIAHFLPVKLASGSGNGDFMWRFSTTVAEFWERFDCVDG